MVTKCSQMLPFSKTIFKVDRDPPPRKFKAYPHPPPKRRPTPAQVNPLASFHPLPSLVKIVYRKFLYPHPVRSRTRVVGRSTRSRCYTHPKKVSSSNIPKYNKRGLQRRNSIPYSQKITTPISHFIQRRLYLSTVTPIFSNHYFYMDILKHKILLK